MALEIVAFTISENVCTFLQQLPSFKFEAKKCEGNVFLFCGEFVVNIVNKFCYV